MTDLRAAMRTITGQDPAPAQQQRIQAIAHALDIPQHDPMFSILAVMDTYWQAMTDIAQTMQASAQKIANGAEIAASKQFDATASKLVEKTSQQLIQTVRKALGRTIFSRAIWAGLVLMIVAIGSFGALKAGLMWDAHQLHILNERRQSYEAALALVKIEMEHNGVTLCGANPCIPIIPPDPQRPWSVQRGPYRGTPLGILNMPAIKYLLSIRH